jgi:heme-degrading monooxygenase HmoA
MSAAGYRGIEWLRMDGDPYTEFMVISYWDSIEATKRFGGQSYTQTHNLPRARTPCRRSQRSNTTRCRWITGRDSRA